MDLDFTWGENEIERIKQGVKEKGIKFVDVPNIHGESPLIELLFHLYNIKHNLTFSRKVQSTETITNDIKTLIDMGFDINSTSSFKYRTRYYPWVDVSLEKK